MRYILILLVFGLVYTGCNHSDRSKAQPSTTSSTPPTGNPPPGPTGFPLGIDTTALPDGQVGVVYDFTLQASGGTPPYSWGNQAAQPLPSGLNLDPNTGRITGMPTATFGSFVGFTIMDADGNATVRDLFLNILP